MPLLEAYCFGQTKVNMSSKGIKSGFMGWSFQALKPGRASFMKRKAKAKLLSVSYTTHKVLNGLSSHIDIAIEKVDNPRIGRRTRSRSSRPIKVRDYILKSTVHSRVTFAFVRYEVEFVKVGESQVCMSIES